MNQPLSMAETDNGCHMTMLGNMKSVNKMMLFTDI